MKYYSITQVLKPFNNFSRVHPEVLQAAAERGTEVHRICLNLIASGIPALNIGEEMKGYVDSFREWFTFVKTVVAIEHEVIDHNLGLVGHIDMICTLSDGREVIVDLKTPAQGSPTWRVQLAAYRRLANSKADTMSLQLSKTGRRAKVKVYEYEESDWAVFLCALNAVRYFDRG